MAACCRILVALSLLRILAIAPGLLRIISNPNDNVGAEGGEYSEVILAGAEYSEVILAGAEYSEVILAGAEYSEVILAGAEYSEVILAEACLDCCRGRDRPWKRFADGTRPGPVNSCVSFSLFDRIPSIRGTASRLDHWDSV